MINLAQSPFLQALGVAIVNSLWQAASLWLIVYLLNYIGKPKASSKYLFTVIAAIFSLCWFAISMLVFYFQFAAPSTESTYAAIKFFAQYSGTGLLKYAKSFIPYLGVAYLLVATILAIRLVNGFREVKTLRTAQLQKAPVALRIFVKKYAAILQIEKEVEIWLSAKVKSPLTIGFWKPVILLPLAGINHLSPQQVEAVLLHELSHIRRFDYLVNIVLQVTEVLMFFNPFVRLLLKKAYQERENSCDDWVLQFDYNGAEYAKALLSIEQTEQAKLLALGANNNQKYYLLHRIARIISREKKPNHFGKQLSTLSIVALTLLLMNGFTTAITTKQQSPTNAVYLKSEFFAPLVKMNHNAFAEIEAAAHAFSIAKNAGMNRVRTAFNKNNNSHLSYDDGAVINMVTEEEEIALTAANAATAEFVNQAFANPLLYEIKAEEFISKNQEMEDAIQRENVAALNAHIAQVQQALKQAQHIAETEGKTKLELLQRMQQKIEDYKSELEALIAAIPAAYIQQLMNAKSGDEYLQQEILKSTPKEKYATATDFVGERQYTLSYNTNPALPTKTPSVEAPTNSSAANDGVKKINEHSYIVSKRNIIRSKDNNHFTIKLGNAEKEISICLPAGTMEATLETMNQLKAAGVLVVDHTLNGQQKTTSPKKIRRIISL